MKTLEAPDTQKSYVTLGDYADDQNFLDEEGLPLRYNKEMIEAYWSKERGALNKRWGEFVGKVVPFFPKLTALFIRDGKIIDSEIEAS
jgi:aarF domain-containing kinase